MLFNIFCHFQGSVTFSNTTDIYKFPNNVKKHSISQNKRQDTSGNLSVGWYFLT